MSSLAELEAAHANQGTKVAELKAVDKTSDAAKAAVQELLCIKREITALEVSQLCSLFLGFGISYPDVSLGQIISEYREAFRTRPWLFWWPGLFIILLALCINFIGDGLRDAFDPRQQAKVSRRKASRAVAAIPSVQAVTMVEAPTSDSDLPYIDEFSDLGERSAPPDARGDTGDRPGDQP